MIVANDSTSYPTVAAAQVFGIPVDLAQQFGWGVIQHARGQQVGFWEERAAIETIHLIGFERMSNLHDELVKLYRRTGIIA